MNIKKLQKRLTKEYGVPDGYVRLDSITIDLDADGNYITIRGAYGWSRENGNVNQNDFELFFKEADGKNYEYIAGMFAQVIMYNEQQPDGKFYNSLVKKNQL